LSSFDFGNPVALTGFKLALVQNGELLVKQTSVGGPTSFNANAGHADLYVVATAATGSAGQYSAIVKRGGNALATVVRAVTDAASTGIEGYTFTATIPSVGNYTLELHDFIFPDGFVTLSATASQDGAVLGTLAAPGTVTLNNVAAGELTIAVLGQPGTGGAGLLGVNLKASGVSTPVFEKTQGVGGTFTSQDIVVSSAGSYKLSFTDFSAPASLAQMRVAITRGATLVASVLGGGSVNVATTPGTYTISAITKAQTSPGYGMFGVSVATAPVINLSATSSVPAGGSTTLNWTATDASACTASGGWSGSKSVSGSTSVGPLSTETTYTLTCTGIGGSSTQSVTVSIQSDNKDSGGGGAESWWLLLVYGVLLASRGLLRRGD
jgi:hypothetical protein